MKTYIYLCDEGFVHNEYEYYVVLSPNYVDTIKCLTDNKKSFVVLDDCWKTKEDVWQDRKYLKKIKKELMVYLKRLLNEYHHTDFTTREWEYVLRAWLDCYTATLYEKYKRIGILKNKGIKGDAVIYSESIPALDFTEFFSQCTSSDEFNNQIAGQLLELIKDDASINLIQRGDRIKIPEIKINKNLGYYKVKIYRWFMRGLAWIMNDKVDVVMESVYLPLKVRLSMVWRSRGKILDYEYDYHRFERMRISRTIDGEWRCFKEVICSGDDEFLKISKMLLKKNLPIAYLEEFSHVYQFAKKWYGKIPNCKAIVYCSGGLIYNEVLKNVLMHIRHKKKDMLFCDIQHGGNYGISKVNDVMTEEYALSDKFYTWGWTISSGICEFIPMPMGKLLGSSINKKSTDFRILYINYVYSKYVSRVDLEQCLIRTEVNKELDFLHRINARVQENLIIRCYPEDYGWHIKDNIKRRVKDARFDTVTNFKESLSAASVVICSAWNTTILEALYANVPVVVMKPLDEVEDYAIDDLKRMKECGILVEDWESLLELVNRFVDEESLRAWWNQKDKTELVRYFQSKYVYKCDDGEDVWVDELLKYCI